MRKSLALMAFGITCLAGVGAASAAGYGMAGCGLGSMAFGAKPGIIQVLAATTNGLFGTQTFGITTGTSNCTDTGGGTASAKSFIQTNREALAKDISRGNGETIANLSTLSGCANAAAVGATLQKNFTQIVPSAAVSDVAVSESVVGVLKADGSLACKKLN